MFSQMGFPTINRHPRPDPIPMFVRYPRHRLRSVPSAAIWAMELHPHHRPRWAAICTISRDMRGDSQEDETK
jgi:hypothetical protein